MTRGAAVEWTMLPGKYQKTYRETCPSTTVSTTGTKQTNMSTNPATHGEEPTDSWLPELNTATTYNT
jgi:hypothetical protein